MGIRFFETTHKNFKFCSRRMKTEGGIKCGKCLTTLIKTDENDHALVCEMSRFPCPCKIYGCEKIGSRKFIRNHLSECTGN